MKLCLYCLRPHERRSRCCSEWCARKVNGKTAWVTRSRREAQARTMAELQRRVRHVPTFRKMAMGELDFDQGVLLITGTKPISGPHRHGEYLDAA